MAIVFFKVERCQRIFLGLCAADVRLRSPVFLSPIIYGNPDIRRNDGCNREFGRYCVQRRVKQ